MTSTTTPDAATRERDRGYGSAVAAVEPGGAEYIPIVERHGRPLQLLWTFSAPNMEFATVGVGILGPLVFGMSFAQTVWAIVLGVVLAAAPHAVLAGWGPRLGSPQMVIGRSAFGFRGNLLPSGLNTIAAGIGWFAVNSVSGALALHALVPALSVPVALLIVLVLEIGVAYFGHNLVQALERFAGPVLGVIFLVASGLVLLHVRSGAASHPIPGAFTLEVTAVFGYAIGWAPFASDYSRYFAPNTSRVAIGASAAGGLLLSCIPLMIAGAAVVTAGQKVFDPTAFTNLLPGWFGVLVLLAIVLGGVSANAMNVYSASVSFAALGIKLPTRHGRAIAAIGLGVLGGVASYLALPDAGAAFTNFLLVISYAIGPWLGIVLIDRILHRPASRLDFILSTTSRNLAGPIAYVVATVVSVALFSNQALYTGFVAKAIPDLGDITCLVGFLLGVGIYALVYARVPTNANRRAVATAPLQNEEAV